MKAKNALDVHIFVVLKSGPTHEGIMGIKSFFSEVVKSAGLAGCCMKGVPQIVLESPEVLVPNYALPPDRTVQTAPVLAPVPPVKKELR
jgi:hypothetical protein